MSSPTMKKQKTVSFISTIRKNRGYGYLLFSNIINRLGDALDTIVFMWIVYAITKNPRMVGCHIRRESRGIRHFPTPGGSVNREMA